MATTIIVGRWCNNLVKKVYKDWSMGVKLWKLAAVLFPTIQAYWREKKERIA